uniref:Guanyl-specific ribonuclease F1 n=1 Tax=Steinernema glaseri TaxID=37863 RepID=A0A1I8AS46_9BILA
MFTFAPLSHNLLLRKSSVLEQGPHGGLYHAALINAVIMSTSTSPAKYATKELKEKEVVEENELDHHAERQSSPLREEVRFDVNLSRWRDERSCFARAPEPEFFTASTPLHRYSGGYSSGARFTGDCIGYVQDHGGLYHASEGRF